MENRNDILNELKELSPTIAAIEKYNVFTVPQGYFDYLGSDIMMGIANESGQSPNVVIDTVNHEIPEGYFNSLAGSVLNKIKAQDAADAATEIRALSPMLYSIQNEKVFDVPQGYFENLTDEIVNTVKPKTKVVNLQSRTRTFFKYAVAAAFTGVMALGVFKFAGNSESQSVLPEYVTVGLNDIKDVDRELAGISNAEIIKYLEASGTDVNAALVANSIDKNELPAQDEYLLDDQALDKYLNSINLDDLKN